MSIQEQIFKEKEKNEKLTSTAAHLEKQIKFLINHSVALLKTRMAELDINGTTPSDLILKAKEIIMRYKELEAQITKLQAEVTTIEDEQTRLLTERQAERVALAAAAVKRAKNQVTETNNNTDSSSNNNASSTVVLGTQNGHANNNNNNALPHEELLEEILATMSHHKKLQSDNNGLEFELNQFEREAVMTPPNGMIKTNGPVENGKVANTNSKPVKRSRKHCSRSQCWPDVPDVAKLEEKDPEILAHKILEIGRLIEAGTIRNDSLYQAQQHQQHHELPRNKHSSNNHHSSSINYTSNNSNRKFEEELRHSNFEERLERIVRKVLSEDQQNLKRYLTNHCLSSINYMSNNSNHRSKEELRSANNFEEQLQRILIKVLNEDQPIHEQHQQQQDQRQLQINHHYSQHNHHQQHHHQSVIHPPSFTSAPLLHNNCYPRPPPIIDVDALQPDDTQAPTKLALSLHLPQDKLEAASQHKFVATHTIGDLVNAEIERTLDLGPGRYSHCIRNTKQPSTQ